MPADLLGHLLGPQPYPSALLVCGVLLMFCVIVWYAAILVWTLPSQRLRRIPVMRRVHARLLGIWFSRRVQHIADEHRAGRTPTGEACAAIGRTVRSFLHQSTGVPAQYLHVEAMQQTELARAVPLLDRLGDARFNAESNVDVGEMSSLAGELIRQWS